MKENSENVVTGFLSIPTLQTDSPDLFELGIEPTKLLTKYPVDIRQCLDHRWFVEQL